MAWLVGSLMAMAAASMAFLLSRVERVRIQPPTPAEPNPAHNRRHGDRTAA